MKSPVRVLLVDHAPIVGGVEVMIRDLLAALDPALAAPVVVTDERSPMRRRFGEAAAEIALPLARLNRNPLAVPSLLASAARLAAVIHRTRAEIVQTFTTRTHLIGALAGLMARRPVVWRINDDTLPAPLAATFGRVPRRVVAVSDYLRAFYRRALHVTDVIPDGVPLPPPMDRREARRSLGLPEEARLAVLAARLVRWKGHHIFLEALCRLEATHPDLHGLVVGGWSAVDDVPGPLGGGEPYRAELEALAGRLGIVDRLTFTGQTPSILPFLAAADVAIHTSLRPEPFGRVVVEAMAAGRPVIAADAGGPREIVVPEVTGLLTPPGDVDALTHALHGLFADPARAEALGQAGRARAAQEYALPRMAERFTEIWLQVARP